MQKALQSSAKPRRFKNSEGVFAAMSAAAVIHANKRRSTKYLLFVERLFL